MNQQPEKSQPDFLSSVITAAEVRASSLRNAFRLSDSEFEDVKQTIVLGLLEQADRYDPAKGSVNTFTGVVSRHLAADISEKLTFDRTRTYFLPLNADEVDTDAANDPEINPTIEGLLDRKTLEGGIDGDLFSDGAVLHDLLVACAYLSPSEVELINLLGLHRDLPSACQASGLSTATFYRRVNDLSMHLRMFGLRSAA
jgi:DNA-directed RNA polymerase specialized sigma24 family protein